ncbi:MAG: 16S rRNA (guanine(527)-N(7))-methyltransferase RsmG [Clostridiales Family XIII bacterium]|jgi:16S rRNA (guanine527-N7)-methyltransferase|nr:16S rRNA (guanine(527)-N(7))-methyltransferase RsmG [Clostridiales Family XIII bacterium]
MSDFLAQHRKLVQMLRSLGVPNAENASDRMLKFMTLVLKRNEIVNLTTITDPNEFVEKHLFDSVRCYGWAEIVSAQRIADVGTGGGFPGVPLALLYPDKAFVLMDSLGKRTTFLEEAVRSLGLENVVVVKCRAEDAGRDPQFRARFDLCVSRAIAKLPVLFEYCLPLLKTGGWLYAYKTNRARSEIDESENARRLLGGSSDVSIRSLDSHVEDFGHNIMVIQKITTTPDTYPRRAGVPAKVPL